MDTIKLKLNRANSLLAKLRYYVHSKLLKTIYSAIFESHLRYGCQLWGQAQTQAINNIEKIQNKALRIINFKGPWESIAPLYKESKIFKLKDIVLLNNLQFVYDQINKNLPKSFHTLFTLKTEQHRHNTRGNSLNVPPVKTTTYGSNSVTSCAIRDWNKVQNQLNPEPTLPDLSGHKFLKTIKIFIADRVDL